MAFASSFGLPARQRGVWEVSQTTRLCSRRQRAPRKRGRVATACRETVEVELPLPLGIELEEATAAAPSPTKNDDENHGRKGRRRAVIVSSVGAGSPANGLVHVGDVLIATSAAAGDETRPTPSLEAAVSAIEARLGDTMKLVFERDTSTDPVDTSDRSQPTTPAFDKTNVDEASAKQENGLHKNTTSEAFHGDPRAATDKQSSTPQSSGSASTEEEANNAATQTPSLPELEAMFNELVEEFAKYRVRRVATELMDCACDVVRALGSAPNPRVSKITSVFTRLRQVEAPLGLRFYNCLMWGYIQAKSPRLALEVFDELPNPNVECYTTLVKAYSALGRPDDALRLLPAMRARGVVPNIRTYNALISACVRSGDLGKATALFSDMVVDSVSPDVVSWNIILNWHAKQKRGVDRLTGTAQAFADMKASGVKPNTITFTTLMKAYAASGAINKAEGIFAEMKKRFPIIRVDTGAYNTLLAAHSARLDWRRCVELLKEMKRIDLEKTAPKWDSADGSDRLVDGGVSASIASSRNVLSNDSYRPSGVRVPVALSDSSRRKRVGDPMRYAEPNAVSYALVIRACADAGQVRIAIAVFEEMIQHGFSPPPSQAIVSLLAAYARSGDFQSSVALIQKLKDWAIVPNVQMMSTLMDSCLNAYQPDLALSVFNRIEGSEAKPDVVVYTMLVRALGMKGDLEQAFQVVGLMQTKGRAARPNNVTYNALIEAACAHGRFDLAIAAFKMMLSKVIGCRTNVNTFKALVQRPDEMKVRRPRTKESHSPPVRGPTEIAEVAQFTKAALDSENARLQEWQALMPSSTTFKSDPDSGLNGESYDAAERLQYLQSVVALTREARMSPNGDLYVALLDACEECEDWDTAMATVQERENGKFLVARAIAADARVYEEALRHRIRLL